MQKLLATGYLLDRVSMVLDLTVGRLFSYDVGQDEYE
jgi:hypothetical protein